jgi:hypothetical protein
MEHWKMTDFRKFIPALPKNDRTARNWDWPYSPKCMEAHALATARAVWAAAIEDAVRDGIKPETLLHWLKYYSEVEIIEKCNDMLAARPVVAPPADARIRKGEK